MALVEERDAGGTPAKTEADPAVGETCLGTEDGRRRGGDARPGSAAEPEP